MEGTYTDSEDNTSPNDSTTEGNNIPGSTFSEIIFRATVAYLFIMTFIGAYSVNMIIMIRSGYKLNDIGDISNILVGSAVILLGEIAVLAYMLVIATFYIYCVLMENGISQGFSILKKSTKETVNIVLTWLKMSKGGQRRDISWNDITTSPNLEVPLSRC